MVESEEADCYDIENPISPRYPRQNGRLRLRQHRYHPLNVGPLSPGKDKFTVMKIQGNAHWTGSSMSATLTRSFTTSSLTRSASSRNYWRASSATLTTPSSPVGYCSSAGFTETEASPERLAVVATVLRLLDTDYIFGIADVNQPATPSDSTRKTNWGRCSGNPDSKSGSRKHATSQTTTGTGCRRAGANPVHAVSLKN